MRYLRTAFLFILFSFSLHSEAAPQCRDIFTTRVSSKPQKVEVSQSIVTWYAPIAMPGEKWIVRDPQTGRRRVQYFRPADGRSRVGEFGNIELSKNARDDERTYYARASLNKATGMLTAELFPIEETPSLTKMIDQTVELTWETYLKQGTVSDREIEEFKKTEAELAPQRKVNFVTTTQEGQTATVLRLFDGSPYPFTFFGDHPSHFEKVSGDPRLPIERRYPRLQAAMREKSNYVFEAGRLAKIDGFDDGLEYQFYNLGAYLMQKFGYLGVSMPAYARDGRIYIEVTARHVRHYMRPRAKGGMGFKLFAAAVNGKEMTLVNPEAESSLAARRDDHESKFVLYLNVSDFISNFYQTIEVRSAKQAYPDRF
jgi:hypothetical protein